MSDKNKPKKKNDHWPLRVFFMAVILSALLSFFSSTALNGAGYVVAGLVLAAFIALGIVFDMIGVAVTAADPKPFHSMAAHKEKGGKEAVSAAAMLLFGKNPKHYFPRARIRFVRYEGTEAKVGAEMNVIKDVVFEGRVLQVIEKALEFVRSQIKERTYLGADTRFVTEPEYPEFAWKELIVNAVAHRDYSIKGTDIQIKMFDDRLTVESPGTLPGIVRLNNMRHVHFSRNPKIAQFLHEYEYVQEFGEGVDRLYEVMETAGLPQPEYRVEAFMLYATIRNTKTDANLGDTPQVTPQVKIIAFCSEPRSKAEIANHCGFKDIKHFTARYLKPLLESGQLRMTAPDKPNSSKQKYITVQPSQ